MSKYSGDLCDNKKVKEIVIDNEYFDNKYLEIPEDIKIKANNATLLIIDEVTRGLIELKYKKFGKHKWIFDNYSHFSWGMWFRNQLRHYGIKDDLFPDGNLDDYYVSIIEQALGLEGKQNVLNCIR
jgi:hypothetical protein